MPIRSRGLADSACTRWTLPAIGGYGRRNGDAPSPFVDRVAIEASGAVGTGDPSRAARVRRAGRFRCRRQPRALRFARPRDEQDFVLDLDPADLSLQPERGRRDGRASQRGQRRPLPPRPRRQPCADARSDRPGRRQAAVRHPKLRRNDPRRPTWQRGDAADPARHTARPDARPRGRNRRRRALGQRLVGPHTDPAGPHPD